MHVPSQCMSSRCAADTAGSISDSMPSYPVGLSATLNTNSLLPRSWSRAWKTAPWIKRLSGMTLPPSMADRGVASWISSLRGSRVSHQEHSSLPETATDQSSQWELEITSLPILDGGNQSPQSRLRTMLLSGEWLLRVFPASSPPTNIPSTPDNEDESGTTSAGATGELFANQPGSTPAPLPPVTASLRFFRPLVSSRNSETPGIQTAAQVHFGGWSGATLPMDGESPDSTDQKDRDVPSSAPRTTKQTPSQVALNPQAIMLPESPNELLSSSTSSTTNSTDSLSNSVQGRTANSFPAGPFHSINTDQVRSSTDTSLETATAPTTQEAVARITASPPSVKHLLLASLSLPSALTAWLQEYGDIKATLEPSSKGEPSTNEHNGSSPSLTVTAHPLSKATTAGRASNPASLMAEVVSITSPLPTTSPTSQMELSSIIASRSVRPESREPIATPDTSGRTSNGSSASADPDSSSSKTFPDCSQLGLPVGAGPSNLSSMDYEAWTTALRRRSSARRKLARPTSASASSSSAWPTPTAADSNRQSHTFGGGNLTLEGAAAALPSSLLDQPITTPGDECSPLDPTSRQRWPTARANDAEKGGEVSAADPRNVLTGMSRGWTLGTGGQSGPIADYTATATTTACATVPTDAMGTTAGCLPNQTLTQPSPMTNWPTSWQTPRANGFDAGRHRGRADSLHSQIKQWPTPNAAVSNDGESLTSWEQRRGRNLAKHTDGNGMGEPLTIAAVTNRGEHNLLNPRFVEWLMNVPIGWTSLDPLDCERSAMASCQRKPPTRCVS